MVTFDKASTFLKAYAKPELVEHVRRFFGSFRGQGTYSHPYDFGHHEDYFGNQEMKVGLLFLTGYRLVMGELTPIESFMSFDGEPLELSDAHDLICAYLQYQANYLQANPDFDPTDRTIDLKSMLLDGRWMYAGFLICEDHEGEMSFAIYDKKLSPADGLTILRFHMRSYFGLVRHN